MEVISEILNQGVSRKTKDGMKKAATSNVVESILSEATGNRKKKRKKPAEKEASGILESILNK